MALEFALFQEMRRKWLPRVSASPATADRLASLDVLVSLAELAHDRGYCRPAMDHGDVI